MGPTCPQHFWGASKRGEFVQQFVGSPNACVRFAGSIEMCEILVELLSCVEYF